MKVGSRGLAVICDFEKLSLVQYDDGYGFPTIGWGHLIRHYETFPHAITLDIANQILHDDVLEAEQIVNMAVKSPLSQAQFDALVSFVFNVGPGRADDPGIRGKDGFVTLRDGRPSTMLRKLNEGDYAGAAAQFPLWCKAGGVESAGLRNRRRQEQALFMLAL